MTVRWPWIAVFAVFVVCIPLFAWKHVFYCDWPNHLGMIAYVGEHVRAHAGLPAMFHTNGAIGRATPMFYGSLYLPVLGTLSAFFGARAAVTIAVAALMLAQFACVRALFRDVARDEAIGCAAAVIVTWAIYPLTDLYNRAALPEFFAIVALQAGSALWVFYTRAPARRERACLAAGLLLTLAIGIHPPTALFGGLTFGALWLASLSWCPDRVRMLKRTLTVGAGAAGVLAPWLYVVVRFRSDLQIVRTTGLYFYRTSLDAVSTRLSLLPTVGPDPGAVSTPNLDAQILTPLAGAAVVIALLAIAARARTRRARRDFVFAATSTVAAAVLFRLSTSPGTWDLLPKTFQVIQFPYRLVAFINVAAVGALAGVLAVLGRDAIHARKLRLVLTAALGVATLGVGIKLPRCLESVSGADTVVTDPLNPPRDWYFGSVDYATPEVFTKVDGATPKEAVALPVGAPNAFAVVGTKHVSVAATTQFSTNVQAFPWNKLTVDGRRLPRSETLVDGLNLAVRLGPGEHDIGYEFRPHPAWSALRALSLVILILWSSAWAFGPSLAWLLARRRAAPQEVAGIVAP